MNSLPQLPSVIISGIGFYTPSKVLTNDELSTFVDTSDEWIRTRSGIRERRIAAPDEGTSDMGVAAAKAALADAGLKAEDVDLLIVGTMTPDLTFPSTACLIQHKLGLRTVPALDVAAACSGFLYTLDVAASMLRGGNYRTALVIGAEKMSSMLNWNDRTTCVLFGDGAGACVLRTTDRPGVGLLDSNLGADGSNPSLLYMPAGGSSCPASVESVKAGLHYLKMNGREVFKLAVKGMETASLQVLRRQGLSADDITCVIPHQANIRIIEALADRLGIGMDRFVINIDRYGNTSAASIPIALAEARAEGRIHSGDSILLAAFGAGLTWGASLIKWH